MKVFVCTRKRLSVMVSCFLLGILCLLAAVRSDPAAAASASGRRIPIYCTEQTEKVISISFDAAWGNEDTQQLIDILEQYGVKATFFVVGQWVDKYPESVKALSDAGHEVENHSDTHPHMPQLSPEEMLQQINACNDKIKSVIGSTPTLLRPPYGDYNNALVDTLQKIGMHCIQWDVDSLDWKELSAPEITQRVVSRVKPGSIVLFHNAAKHTPEALPGILEQLQAQGYRIVPISQLIDPNSYETDHEGRQIPSTPVSASSAGDENSPSRLSETENTAETAAHSTEAGVFRPSVITDFIWQR